VPKRPHSAQIELTTDELREMHLALRVRIAELSSMDTRKMGPTAKEKVARQIEICNELHDVIQKARGK
jgi:hypothetical protein